MVLGLSSRAPRVLDRLDLDLNFDESGFARVAPALPPAPQSRMAPRVATGPANTLLLGPARDFE